MVLPKDKTASSYQDADMAKLGILEDIGLGNPDAAMSTTDTEVPVTNEGTTDANQELSTDATDVPADTTNSDATDVTQEGDMQEPTEDVMTEGDTEAELSEEDLDSFLKELAAADTATQEAVAKTDDAITSGNSDEIAKALEDERKARAESDRLVDKLTMQLKIEKEGTDKILEEKFLMETDLREKSKLADVITADPALKQLVVLKSRAENDPAMRDRYVNTLRDLYEEASGMPIKDMVDSMKKMEKSGLSAGGNYTFEGDNPTQTLAGGMLEKI